MNKNNNENEIRRIEDFIDDEECRDLTAQSGQYETPPQTKFYRYPRDALPLKKNTAVIVLLCCILLVGIAILSVQIINSFNGGGNDVQNLQNQPEYDMPFQNAPDTYGNYGPEYNGDGEQHIYQGGPGNGGASLGGQYRAPDGTIIQFRSKDSKTEYSKDGGKTWSETPPEGMPPLP